MAWTKTKTVIIGSVVALLAIGTGVVTVSAINTMRAKAALAAVQGSWEGTLNISPAKLRVVLNILKTNDTWYATLDSIDQGQKGLPVPTFSARSTSFEAALPALGADFHATLSADKSEMDGTWKQLNRSIPLTLMKTTTPDTVATLTTDQYAPRADSDLQGEWAGALKVGKATLHLDLRISEPSSGTFQATMGSLDQGAVNFPITTMTYERPKVRFEMKAIAAVYEGNFNSQGQLEGAWTQMHKKFPLTFERVQPGALAAVEAQKDYGTGASYQVQGHWKGVLKVGGAQLHVVIHIAQMPDGSYSASMDSPDQGATGLPATTADCNFPNVHLTWKIIGGVFTGKMDSGKLSGTWRQGKVSLPLRLVRDTSG